MLYEASCTCGEVKVELDKEPVAQMLCHCKNCRSWSAAPITGATLFEPDSVRIVSGTESLKRYSNNEGHEKCWCDKCGGHVMNDHKDTYGIIDVYGSIIKGFEFKPTAHVNYENTIVPMKDGLPKFKDFPEDFGGSGEMINE